MLIDMMTGKQIAQVPYLKDYQTLIGRLSATEIAAMKRELNTLIQGTDIQTAGWMPGSD